MRASEVQRFFGYANLSEPRHLGAVFSEGALWSGRCQTMVVLLGQIIPIGLLLALGPTRIMSTILLLTSAHPLRNALTF
jgi:hypothetical protein